MAKSDRIFCETEFTSKCELEEEYDKDGILYAVRAIIRLKICCKSGAKIDSSDIGGVNVWLAGGYGPWRNPDTPNGTVQDPTVPHPTLIGAPVSVNIDEKCANYYYKSPPLGPGTYTFYMRLSSYGLESEKCTLTVLGSGTYCIKFPGKCSVWPFGPKDPSKVPPQIPPKTPPKRPPGKRSPRASLTGVAGRRTAAGQVVNLSFDLSIDDTPSANRRFDQVGGTVDFYLQASSSGQQQKLLGTRTLTPGGGGNFSSAIDAVVTAPPFTTAVFLAEYSGEEEGMSGVNPDWDTLIDPVSASCQLRLA